MQDREIRRRLRETSNNDSGLILVVIVATIVIVFAIIVFETRPPRDDRISAVCNNCSYDVNEKPSYTDKLLDPISVFTLFLVVSTVALWRSTERLANIASEQSEDMAKSIAEAARAATAMEGVMKGIEQTVITNEKGLEAQRDFWSRQMRAYISIDTGSYVRQNQRNGLKFEFRPNIINNGVTPANFVKVFSRCDIKPVKIASDFDFSLSKAPISFLELQLSFLELINSKQRFLIAMSHVKKLNLSLRARLYSMFGGPYFIKTYSMSIDLAILA